MTSRQILFPVVALVSGALALVPLLFSFTSTNGNIPGLGLEGAIFCAFWGLVCFLALRRVWPFFSPYPSMIIGAIMVAKPKLAPVLHIWQGKKDPFPLFSETHLYFIIPGVLLIAWTFVILLRSEEK